MQNALQLMFMKDKEDGLSCSPPWSYFGIWFISSLWTPLLHLPFSSELSQLWSVELDKPGSLSVTLHWPLRLPGNFLQIFDMFSFPQCLPHTLAAFILLSLNGNHQPSTETGDQQASCLHTHPLSEPQQPVLIQISQRIWLSASTAPPQAFWPSHC